MKKAILTIILLFVSIGSFSTNSLISMWWDISFVYSNYELTGKDKLLINKFVNKFDRVIQKKWEDYKNLLVTKISDFLDKWSYSSRLTSILEEIINRIDNIIILKDQLNKDELFVVENKKEEKSFSNSESKEIEKINLSKVRKTWLSWYNDVRKDIWKANYSYDSRLDNSALEWSKLQRKRWEMSHKRDLWDSYYDYNKITSWFKDRWIVCKNINRATNTENIWLGWFYCIDWECSDELITSMKKIFDKYMAEKWTSNDAHYKSIVHPYFTKIWMWLEVEKLDNLYYKFYITTHYCTELM